MEKQKPFVSAWDHLGPEGRQAWRSGFLLRCFEFSLDILFVGILLSTHGGPSNGVGRVVNLFLGMTAGAIVDFVLTWYAIPVEGVLALLVALSVPTSVVFVFLTDISIVLKIVLAVFLLLWLGMYGAVREWIKARTLARWTPPSESG